MKVLNKLLLRQISKYLGNGFLIPDSFSVFLNVISETYNHSEKDRKMLERSIELSSREMVELNHKLKEETIESQKAHRELNRILENIDEVVFSRDMITGKYIYVSAACEKVYGYSANEFIENPVLWKEVIHPDDVELILIKNQNIGKEKAFTLQYRIIHKDQSVRWIDSKVIPTLDDSGKLITLDVIVNDITETKTARRKLEEANNDLNKLFNNIDEVLFSAKVAVEKRNVCINLLQISPGCIKIYGYSVPEFFQSGSLWYTVIPDEDKGIVNSHFPLLIKGKPVAYQHRIRHKDGSIRWIETKITPTLGESGMLVRIDGATTDITEKKISEKKLEEANQELKKLFDNINEVLFSVDMLSYKVIQMSAACEKVYGYTPEEFMENNDLWRGLSHPEDKEIIERQIHDLFQGKEVHNQYRIIHKDNGIRWIENTIIPTMDETGRLERLDGVTSDITKRKEFEIALQNSEYRFRSLIEHSSDAITVINEKAEIIYASDSLHKITGFKPEEVVGIKSTLFVHPDDLQEIQRDFIDLVSSPGKTKTVAYRRLKKDGSYIWCEGVVTNLMDQPAVRGMVVNFRDTTERKEYIEAIKSSNEELKKANSELDKFVYSASHDLRAPLSSMQGIIFFLESGTSDPLMLNDIGLLKRSIDKLDNFILDIIDYSRNARLEVKKEKIDFKELLNDSIDNLKFMSSGNNHVDIRFQIADEEVFYSDKSRMSIIFNNLISNAIRYSDPQATQSFVEIKVRTSKADTHISIKDNGIGISKENHQKVFDMFYRISNKSVGSGIGLYIVKETIEKLNGAIMLESEPGKGTVFNISLPNFTTHFKEATQ